MQEIEIKLRLATVASAKRLLLQSSFVVETPRHLERNLLLETTPPSLRPAGAMLRVRQAHGETILTYKGRGSVASRHKVREEHEVTVQDFESILQILTRLGYQSTFRYDKYRTIYARGRERGHAMLDETPIGPYLELEGSPAWIDRTAAMLGYSEADYITESYSALWAQHRQASGQPPADFVFPSRRKP